MKSLPYYLIGILCLVLLGAGALLWNESSAVANLHTKLLAASEAQARRDARHAAEQTELAQRAQQMEQHIQELEQRAGTAAARARELEAQLAEAKRAASAAESTVSPTPAPVPAPPTKPWLAAASDPGNIQAQAAGARLQMEMRYGALAQRLGLTPAQTDQFMKLLVDRKLAGTDATLAALQQGSDALDDPAAFATLVAASRDEIDSQIHALLGDSGYVQYRQLGLAAGQTGTLGLLQTALGGTEPLSDAQLAQLRQLLADNHVGHITAKVFAAAQSQGFLTPVQLQALQNLFQQQQAARQSRRASQPPVPGGK